METKGKCGPALRRRKPDSRNSWTQKGQWNGKMFAYVRLCSPVFAYVRLMREKLVRALSAAAGERGKRANFKFLTVRSLISAWTGGGYGNAVGAARGHYWGLQSAKAEGVSDRNTFFIYDTVEHGSGLEENLRLSSLIPAYARLSSLNGKKMLRGRR